MNDKIDAVIERLCAVELFASVGSSLRSSIAELDVVEVTSWNQAISIRGSDGASDAFSQARTLLARQLSDSHRKQFRQWNVIVRNNRQAMESNVFPKVDQCIDQLDSKNLRHGDKELLKSIVKADYLCFATEQAYAQLVKPAVYTALLHIYELGHLPCNWNEIWPNGKLWIY